MIWVKTLLIHYSKEIFSNTLLDLVRRDLNPNNWRPLAFGGMILGGSTIHNYIPYNINIHKIMPQNV